VEKGRDDSTAECVYVCECVWVWVCVQVRGVSNGRQRVAVRVAARVAVCCSVCCSVCHWTEQHSVLQCVLQ